MNGALFLVLLLASLPFGLGPEVPGQRLVCIARRKPGCQTGHSKCLCTAGYVQCVAECTDANVQVRGS